MRSLDLIVIHHADAGSTRACVVGAARELDLLERLGPARIIVVDNGPTGEVDDLARADRVEVLAAPRRQGFGANVNLAASRSDAELLLLLNDDASIDAASIEALAEALHSGAGLVGPRILDADRRPAPSAWRFPTVAGVAAFAFRQDGPPWVQSGVGRTSPVDVLTGAVLMIPREIFVDRLGGFDPDYFMFSEDADLSRRLADHGLERLIVPRATAIHTGQGSTAGHERRRDVEQWRSRSIYWRKHHRLAERIAIRILYCGAYAAGAGIALVRGGAGRAARRRARRLLFLARCTLRTPAGPGLRELAAEWVPPPRGRR